MVLITDAGFMELTEVQFWDDYWANCRLPNVVDLKFSFDRCLAKSLRNLLCECHGEVLEIGCAPGKWLAYLNKELGLIPYGIEYSDAGMAATKKNFEMLNLAYGNMWSGDFFQMNPPKKFDIVLSLGFIEHFSNVDEVVEQHLQWLKPGGVLVLGVPNFRGIYKIIQMILDKSLLDKHNLDIMDPIYFAEFARQRSLEIVFSGYLGSFEPSLPIANKGHGSLSQFMVKAFLKLMRVVRGLEIFDDINHPFISSYLLTVYKK
jgi:2-polyprenyl-3-methyl-5-hydroxy-6-metoxy-1,4-benzoquinol methylase